jgi:type IV pilus assembly protein PilV
MSAATKRCCPSRLRARSRGFTLFEVLIAFLILSIGLAGVVTLQALAKASQHQSLQRSRAVTMADQMIEQIRSNPRGVTAYVRTGGNALGGGSIAEEPAPNCITAACTPAEMAAHDLWAWEQELDGADVTAADGGGSGAGLIQPRGCVFFNADTGKVRTGSVDVVIQWRGLQDTADAVQAGGVVCGTDFSTADAGFRRQVILSSYVVDEQEL